MDKLDLINIDTKSSEYHFVETLMLSSFPSDERRDESLQRRIMDDDDRMRCLVIKDGDVSVGFITVWTFHNICSFQVFILPLHKSGKDSLRPIKLGILRTP